MKHVALADLSDAVVSAEPDDFVVPGFGPVAMTLNDMARAFGVPMAEVRQRIEVRKGGDGTGVSDQSLTSRRSADLMPIRPDDSSGRATEKTAAVGR